MRESTNDFLTIGRIIFAPVGAVGCFEGWHHPITFYGPQLLFAFGKQL